MEGNPKKTTKPSISNNPLPTGTSQDSEAVQEMPCVSRSLECSITI